MITLDRLKEVLNYNPDTGVFTWKIINSNAVLNKNYAGGVDEKGYIRIKIDNKKYRAHRLAFMYMVGRWPVEIDHINLNKSDNRWCNLREANRSQNCLNKNVKSTNILGVKGVSKVGNKYSSEISVNGFRKYLGLFNSLEEAKMAYNDAAMFYHGDFSRS